MKSPEVDENASRPENHTMALILTEKNFAVLSVSKSTGLNRAAMVGYSKKSQRSLKGASRNNVP